MLMVLAGGWAAYISRPASTWPLSISATIQAAAGPSEMLTEPIGWILGSMPGSAPAGTASAIRVTEAATADSSLSMVEDLTWTRTQPGRSLHDRLEIQQLLVDYSTAIDQRRFDDLKFIFNFSGFLLELIFNFHSSGPKLLIDF